jgi:hypothetical protein
MLIDFFRLLRSEAYSLSFNWSNSVLSCELGDLGDLGEVDSGDVSGLFDKGTLKPGVICIFFRTFFVLVLELLDAACCRCENKLFNRLIVLDLYNGK